LTYTDAQLLHLSGARTQRRLQPQPGSGWLSKLIAINSIAGVPGKTCSSALMKPILDAMLRALAVTTPGQRDLWAELVLNTLPSETIRLKPDAVDLQRIHAVREGMPPAAGHGPTGPLFTSFRDWGGTPKAC
jgi:hypothetical protein